MVIEVVELFFLFLFLVLNLVQYREHQQLCQPPSNDSRVAADSAESWIPHPDYAWLNSVRSIKVKKTREWLQQLRQHWRHVITSPAPGRIRLTSHATPFLGSYASVHTSSTSLCSTERCDSSGIRSGRSRGNRVWSGQAKLADQDIWVFCRQGTVRGSWEAEWPLGWTDWVRPSLVGEKLTNWETDRVLGGRGGSIEVTITDEAGIFLSCSLQYSTQYTAV